ncbi:hypothetical protein OS21_39180 [Dickeya oryzae]
MAFTVCAQTPALTGPVFVLPESQYLLNPPLTRSNVYALTRQGKYRDLPQHADYAL